MKFTNEQKAFHSMMNEINYQIEEYTDKKGTVKFDRIMLMDLNDHGKYERLHKMQLVEDLFSEVWDTLSFTHSERYYWTITQFEERYVKDCPQVIRAGILGLVFKFLLKNGDKFFRKYRKQINQDTISEMLEAAISN